MTTALNPLSHQTWISLREAARRIGAEILGSDWNDKILDRDRRTDPTLRDIQNDLYKVLDSGEVEVHIDFGEGPRKLSLETALHFATEIDIKLCLLYLPTADHDLTPVMQPVSM